MELKKCAYCREDIPENDLEEKTLIGKNWARNNFESPLRPYHKSLGCHMKDQMGHEG